MNRVSIVVPTVGRTGLHDLLKRLKEQLPAKGVELIVIHGTHAKGPAAARNEGWRRATGEWVVFLDDDVLPSYTWWHYLQDDLDQPPEVAGVRGQVVGPSLNGHKQTTVDMAYRRDLGGGRRVRREISASPSRGRRSGLSRAPLRR